RTVQEKASQSLGSRVQFRDYALSWSGISPAVELSNIAISGAAPYQSPALLTADSLRIGVTVSSLLHRSWYVNDIAVAHPVVLIFTDHAGQPNLPHSGTKSSSQSNFDIFQLGVRNASIRNGEIYYNNRKSDLDADVHDLGVQIGFAAIQQKYSGTISYRDG